jgi:hypothetical protein
MKNLTIAFLAAASLFTVGACKKKGGAAEAVAKMTEFKDAMCKCTDKACADKVNADMMKYGESMKGKKEEKPDQAMIDKMMGIMGEYSKCQEKAMGAGGDAAGSAAAPAAGSAEAGSAAPAAGSGEAGSAAAAAPAAGGGDLPAECNEYKAAIEALAKCDKLPQQAKDALKQSYEQTSAAWASVPAEGKAALGTACKAAVDAVKQSAAVCN